MKAILFQLDGKLPNLALMRIAAWHRNRGDEVELRGPDHPLEPQLWDSPKTDMVYGSLIFEKTRAQAIKFANLWPTGIVGGTGFKADSSLSEIGIEPGPVDYSVYPNFEPSIGFSQRGCRLNCSFCVVPKKEGKVKAASTIEEIWRGDPYPRHIVLLDNDFFGQPKWRDRIAEMVTGGFRVNFTQGINVRFLNDETAAAISLVDYRSTDFKRRSIYTAWDSRKDERRVLRGLELLTKHGVTPRNITVYMLIGFWPGETVDDWLYRAKVLRDFGALPYPMPYKRTREAVGFQRWIIGAYDKPRKKPGGGYRQITWAEWVAADYNPRKLK